MGLQVFFLAIKTIACEYFCLRIMDAKLLWCICTIITTQAGDSPLTRLVEPDSSDIAMGKRRESSQFGRMYRYDF